MTTFNLVTQRPQVVVDEAALQALQQETARRQQDLERLRIAMEILAAMNECERFAAASMALVNELCARWSAERVSLGFLKGRYMRVVALSHTEKFTRQMRLIQDIEAAMEECFDQDVEIVYPAAPEASYVSRATQHLSSSQGNTSVAAFPLRRAGDVHGVLIIERHINKPLQLIDVEALRLTADLTTSRLIDLFTHDRWFGAKFAAATRTGLAWFVGARNTWIKAGAAAIAAVLAFSFLVHGRNQVEASFTFEPVAKRVVPAQFDSKIESVVKGMVPGATVHKGDLLATLDIQDEEAKLAGALADKYSYLKQADIATRDGKIADAQADKAQADAAAAHAQESQIRIDEAQIRAPIDGIILSGDLRGQLNAPVRAGDSLFEIGSVDDLRAELSVPEYLAGYLFDARKKLDGKPLTGTLATATDPSDKIPFVVDRINPMAKMDKDKNVFLVKAIIAPTELTKRHLRPGMEGMAKVDVGQATYFWLWTHTAIDWLRMKLWLWT
jgi:multidrug efflux pump subunit AcrA (membrane-fusion protein)